MPFVEFWRYTRDRDWAERVGYPFVAEALEFWECWLVHNATTGAFDDINDEISELGFFSESRDTPGFIEANPVSPTLISGRERSFGSGRELSVGHQLLR